MAFNSFLLMLPTSKKLRGHIEIGSWNLIYGISMKNKWTHIFFSFPSYLSLQSYDFLHCKPMEPCQQNIWRTSAEMFSHRLIMEKRCFHFFSVTMNSIFIKLTGNKERHKMLDGFKFRLDLMRHFWFTYPWVVKKMISWAFLSCLW